MTTAKSTVTNANVARKGVTRMSLGHKAANMQVAIAA